METSTVPTLFETSASNITETNGFPTTPARGSVPYEKSAAYFSSEQEIPGTSIVCDLLLWKKPLHSIVVLLIATTLYMYSVAIDQSLISSTSNLLLYLITTFCLVTNLSDFLQIKTISVPLPVEMSSECAACLIASFANLIGAAEGVLRVAAFGSDFKLFVKVVSFLLFTSALGKILSGKTIAYLGVWFLFTVPVALSRLCPEKSCTTPYPCRKRTGKKSRRSCSFKHIVENSGSMYFTPSLIQFDS